MGSLIIINDTLRISKEQGFPKELSFDIHKEKPFEIKDFKDKIFEFKAKDKIRMFQQPPVNTFLVEDINGKWMYWGLCHIQEIKHDYIAKTTSGKYKIVHINSLDEMEMAFKIRDRVDGNDFFDNF